MRIKEEKKILTKEEESEVARLETELDRFYELLADDPGNELLNRRAKEIEIKIVCLTGEKTMEY